MKQRKSEDAIDHFNPEEACASIASIALGQGNERPVGHYIRDLGQILDLIAGQFDPPNDAAPIWQGVPLAETPQAEPADSNDEWEGTIDQITSAVEGCDAKLIGSYLRDAAGILSRLADDLDPNKSKGRRLEFVRRGSGRPKDVSLRMKFSDQALRAKLRRATEKAGKQESAILDLKASGQSRPTLFRKKRGSSKSHKKR